MPNRTPKPPKTRLKETHRTGRKFVPKDTHLLKSKARNAGPPPTKMPAKASVRYPEPRMGYVRGTNRSGRGGHDEYL